MARMLRRNAHMSYLGPDPGDLTLAEMYMTPCELCQTPTLMLGTKRCDRCWELETRIKSDPELTRRILQTITKERLYDGGTETEVAQS